MDLIFLWLCILPLALLEEAHINGSSNDKRSLYGFPIAGKSLLYPFVENRILRQFSAFSPQGRNPQNGTQGGTQHNVLLLHVLILLKTSSTTPRCGHQSESSGINLFSHSSSSLLMWLIGVVMAEGKLCILSASYCMTSGRNNDRKECYFLCFPFSNAYEKFYLGI